MKTSTIFVVWLVSACGPNFPVLPDFSHLKEEWNPQNDPALLPLNYKLNFDELPLFGETTTKPWSDDYWPSYKGGIAARWKSGEDGFSYKILKKEEVRKLSREQLEMLSPAEKYDLYIGNYNFDLVKSERRRTNANRPKWEGLCHGWAAASLIFKDPKPVDLKNADGIVIPFGASDIKALLTFYQSHSDARSRLLGQRCNTDFGDDNPDRTSPHCRDTNAGSFHVTLANHVGISKVGFVADLRRDLEVWNHPIFAYSSQIENDARGASPGAAPTTVREITFRTKIYYGTETSPMWDPIIAPHGVSERVYSYRLELDQDNLVVGGEWLQDDRPDFLWIQARPQFRGYFQKLKTVYDSATQM